MKNLTLLLLFIAIFINSHAQSVNVTATLGTASGSYATLKLAFDNINNGIHKGIITISIINSTTEAVSAVLNASGSGSASYTSITIQPSGGAAKTISGSLAAPLVDLNGADNVTIDGLNTGGNSLTVSNASTSSLTNTSTIRFIQDATNNTITNCTLEGAGTSTALGTVYFSTGIITTGVGNDANTISNSTITSAGGNLPVNAVYSSGRAVTIDNSGISILNNNIQDYYNPTNASNGVFVAANSSAWTISGNKFFQTATRTATAGTTSLNVHRAINIVTPSGISYTVNNNIIGYANASGTGITTYDGAFTNRFVGIEMSVANGTVSGEQGNIVSGISLSTTSASALPGIFCGISVLSGNVNIGTTAGNTIGAATGTGSVLVTSTTTASVIAGIYATSTGSVSIQNNVIGSIAMNGSALIGYTFYGINTLGTAGNFTLSLNTIGSTTTAGSVTVGTDPVTTAVGTFNGIVNSSTGTTSITGNTIQNCSVYSSGAAVFNGLVNSGSTGTLNITTNNIISGTNTGTGSFTCISNAAAAATVNINSNIIRNHSRTAGSGAFIGISNTGAAVTAINILSNQLGNASGGTLTFTNASTGTITGIINNAGTATTTLNINNNSLQGFSVVSSGIFTGISNTGAAVGVNINSNQIGTTTGNAITYSAANTTAINGIVNTGGSATAILTLDSNYLQGFLALSLGAFTGINNTGAGAAINISYNLLGNTTGALTLSSVSAGTITGIINNAGAATTTVTINSNSLKGFSVVSSGIFTGISNAGAPGVAVNLSYNQIGTSTGNAITYSAANTTTINGILNSGGAATAIVSLDSNYLQGFSGVSSSGAFTGISNTGAGSAININYNFLGNTTGALTFTSASTGTITGITNNAGTATTTVTINSNSLKGFSVASSGIFTGISNAGTPGVAVNINYNLLGTATTNAITYSAANTTAINGILNSGGAATAIVSLDSNYLQGFSGVSCSGAFTGISNSGVGAAININYNFLGSTIGALTFSNTSAGTITGIINNAGTTTTTVTINNNSILGFSVVSSGAFTGISNAGATGVAININNNVLGNSSVAIFSFTALTGTITGITNSGGTANTNVSIYNNSLQGFSGVAAGTFLGINNSVAGAAVNITYNQVGNSTGGVLTLTSASAGAITGISNTAGIATTTLNINNNTLQGFFVVSSGAFTGIVNSGAAGVAININNNLLGTTTGNAITYSAANSAALTGISNTAGAATCALSIQSNDIRKIVHTIAGTSAHNYIINSAATLSQSISANTFTNLDVNTTGSILFISDNVIVPATGTQHIDADSIVGTFTRTAASTSGILTLFNSTAASVAGAVITNSNNNFSHITVSGAAAIAGWINTDAGAGTKTISGNTFSTWTAGTGLVTVMTVSVTGTSNALTGNNINNINSGGNITAITTGVGNDNIYANTISSISSTGTGATLVNGIVVTAGTVKNIYQNTLTALKANFNNLTGNIQNSLAVNGIWISGGTTVNVNQNVISGFTGDAIDAGTVNGISVSGGTTVNVTRNKIYDLSSNSTAINSGGISGILVFSVAGSVTNIINNMIGDLRTPVSANSDALRAISVNVTTVSNINVYFNTVYLNATSSALNFGCSGIYHSSSSNPLIGTLDLRNNIITNNSTPTGTSLSVVFRQYAAPLNNYASVSNYNLFYAGTPGPNKVIYNDATNSDQTMAAFQTRLNGRDSLSFSEDLSTKIISFAGSSPYYLHIDSTKCTRVESGGINISGITIDYDGQTRQGNPGYTGTGTAPDLGADEIEGSATPRGVITGTATICNGSSATLTLGVTGTGTLSGTLSNGTAFSGTAPAITINVTPTIATTYTIATLTNGTCTSAAADKSGSAVISIAPRPTGALSGTATICNGGSTNLTITATGTGTISGTLSDGTVFSGTAPTITVSVSPSITTSYTISTLTNGTCTSIAADKTGSGTVTVNARPTGALSGTATICNGGSTNLTITATGTGTISGTLSDGTAFSGTAPTITVSVSPSTTTSYTISTLTNGTCASITADKTGSATVTVNARPTGILSGSTTICNGSNTNLTITATGTGTISGTLSDGTAFSGTAPTITISVSPLVVTTYTISTLLDGTCTAIAADRTGSAIISIVPRPTGVLSGTATICNGSGTNLTITATGTGTISGTLSDGTVFSGAAPTITVSVSPSATTSYTISTLTNGTCTSIAADKTGGAIVTVNPGPKGALSGTATICNGSTTNLIIAAIGAGTISGTLSDGTVFSGTAPAITVGVSPSTTTAYTISTLTNGTCISIASDKTGSATVTVGARPTGVLSGTTAICNGGSTNLIITATGTGTISGTLSDGTTFSGAAPTITISVNPSATKTYTISTLTNGTCASIAADKTGSAVVSVTIPPAVSMSYTGTPFCSNTGIATVTLTGTPGGTYSSTPAGASINLSTGTVNLAASLPGKYTITYTVAPFGGCSIYSSNAVIIINPNTWTGGISTDWNTAGNWAGNAIPTMSCPDITILGGVPYQPTLNSGSVALQNLFINSGAILTVTNATLQISGTINNSGTFDVSDGSIEMNGSGTQTIPANSFLNNAIKDLVISNSSTTGVVLGGALDIYQSLTFGGAGTKLTTNDVLTLKSTATKTAWVGDMTGKTVTGKVTVERYISAHKAWQYLSIPTNTIQTVRQAWQEGGTSNTSNPVPGYGAQITGAAGLAAGFDLYTATPSMKTYNSATNTWVGIANTNIATIKTTVGYMTFIRGDRAANSFSSLPSQTVLRTSGNLYSGDLTPIPVVANLFAGIGNPYASALDMRNIATTGLKEFFYVWDPRLGGNFGYGAYQTFSYNGTDYEVTPGMGSYGAAGSTNNYIQSGQAFLVQATATEGSLTFKEAAKSSGSALISVVGGASHAQLRTSLYAVNADSSSDMLDGVLNSYDDSYSNAVDNMDAIKSANSAENLSIKTANTLLVIERRFTIAQNDTIFLNIGNVRVQKYRFVFAATKLSQPGLAGFLEDSYSHTSTPLNLDGSTAIDFNIVNIPGSYAANRFRIVFKQLSTLAVTFSSVKAYQQNKDIAVEWKAENESNLEQYDVEKSVDGNHYATVTTVAAKNAATSLYNWLDVNPSEGNNYYRIRSTDINGKIAYSTVVKVYMGKVQQSISVYPNPVVNGTINLQLTNQPKGEYGIRLMNKLGQVMITKQINHTAGSSTETIQLKNYSAGIYQIEVSGPNDGKTNINVSVLK